MTDKELNRLRAIIINADASLDEYKILMATLMDAHTEEAMHLQRLEDTGTEITCPNCNKQTTVYHFKWEAITCGNCDAMVAKKDWELHQEFYPGENLVDLDKIKLTDTNQ